MPPAPPPPRALHPHLHPSPPHTSHSTPPPLFPTHPSSTFVPSLPPTSADLSPHTLHSSQSPPLPSHPPNPPLPSEPPNPPLPPQPPPTQLPSPPLPSESPNPPLPPQPPSPPLPPQLSEKQPYSHAAKPTTAHLTTEASPESNSGFSEVSGRGGDKDDTSAGKIKGFGGMKFKTAETTLGKRSGTAIRMKIGKTQMAPEAKKSKVVNSPVKKTALVSQAFGDESDDEEEMPPEAKLRMRNLGKNTPTSSGPNSFHKSKMGFSDPRAGYKRYYEED